MARMIDAEFLEQEISKWINRPDDGEYYCGYDNALTAVLDLIADAPTITQPNEWINMEDRPPEFPGFSDHIMVVTCDKNGHVMPMVRERTLVGYEWMERWLFPWNEIYVGPEITHWMQLPKPPKGMEDVEFSAATESDCEYCSGDPTRPLDWQYGLDHIFPDYKYCPMCGRKVQK